MEYRLTFKDGSDAYLAHHGVKGMKWGVWNNDTKNRYMGSKSKGRRFAESMAVWTTMDLASNGVAIARGKKTFQEKLGEDMAEAVKTGEAKKTAKQTAVVNAKNQNYKAMKNGYKDGKRLRKKNGIKSDQHDISQEYDKIDSVYKQAYEEYASKNIDKPSKAKVYGEGLLSGLIGESDPSIAYKRSRTGAE